MKKIGILGGISSASTVDYYKTLMGLNSLLIHCEETLKAVYETAQ